jgi:hypothetical protein
VLRLSVASLDSGAKSPVYGEEPLASADRDLAPRPSWSGGGGRWAVRPTRVGAPFPASGGSVTSLQVPQGGATRDITATAGWALPGQVGAGVPRLAASYDMSVVDQQSGKWYVKDIRAATQPMGIQ